MPDDDRQTNTSVPFSSSSRHDHTELGAIRQVARVIRGRPWQHRSAIVRLAKKLIDRLLGIFLCLDKRWVEIYQNVRPSTYDSCLTPKASPFHVPASCQVAWPNAKRNVRVKFWYLDPSWKQRERWTPQHAIHDHNEQINGQLKNNEWMPQISSC